MASVDAASNPPILSFFDRNCFARPSRSRSSNALAPSASTITPTTGPNGRSGHFSISVTVCPCAFSTSTDLRKLSRTAGCTRSYVPFTVAMRALRLFCACIDEAIQRARPGGKTFIVVGSFSSSPRISPKTVLQSAAVRHIGPSLSSVQQSAIAPWRLTAPYVGRSPLTPQNDDGVRIEPEVSLPIANGTSPAPTAAPGPLDDPPDQNSGFQGERPGPVNDASALL